MHAEESKDGGCKGGASGAEEAKHQTHTHASDGDEWKVHGPIVPLLELEVQDIVVI
jgi:hypothetical protein